MTEVNSGQETGLVEYSAIDAGLATLKEKYEGRVYEVTTTAGMTDAKKARAEVRGERSKLEAIRKGLKVDILERGRLIDGEANRIKAAILDIEEPIDTIIKAQEGVKQAEKEKREAAERKRIEDIQDRIDAFRFTLSEFHPVSDLQERLNELNGSGVDDSFGEFGDRAGIELVKARAQCYRALCTAQEREGEKMKADEARAAEAAQQAEKQAVIDKENEAKAEAQAKEDERLKAERERLRAEEEKRDKELADRDAAEQEQRREAADKAERAEAKCESHLLALRKIVEICQEETLSHANKVRKIQLTAEANIVGGG